MTSIIRQAVDKIEAIFTTVEGDIKAEFVVLDTAVGNFLNQVKPQLLADLTSLAKAAEQDLISDPGKAFTTLLNQAENLASTEWKAMEPTVQTAVLQAISSMIQVGASLL